MIYFGNNETQIYYGENEAVIYYGDNLVYPTTIVGLTVNPLNITNQLKYAFQKTIKIVSESNWTISCDADWVSFDVTSGEMGRFKVNCSVTENNTEEERNTVVTVSNQTESKTLSITQGVDDITFVEYIESKLETPTFIETGYMLNLDSEIEATIELNDIPSNFSSWTVLLGGYPDNNGVCIRRTSSNREVCYKYGNGGLSSGFTWAYRTKNGHFIFNKDGFTFDDGGSWKIGTATSISTATQLCINADADPNAVGDGELGKLRRYSYAKYGEIIVRENGVVLHDYKPAVRNNEVGMYDSVTQQMIYPSVGSFTAGPQKNNN